MLKSYLSLYAQQLQPKVVEMYEACFIRSLRYASAGETTYVTGRISAEMSKLLVYVVDIQLDKHGAVIEAQCECAAGSGPGAHCKHVAVVLFALTKTQYGIRTMETCTQVLQTFHQVKQYSGSPVKMENVKMRSEGPLAHLASFDPRPQNYRHQINYPTHFRNTWINAGFATLPVLQLYPPANMHAVNNDHDYQPKCPADIFLDSFNITKIDDDTQRNVETETRGQASNKKWQHERTKRIHASHFGRICLASDTRSSAMRR